MIRMSDDFEDGHDRVLKLVALLNRLEQHWRPQIESGAPMSFGQLTMAMSDKSATVRRYALRIRAFSHLRNALVHGHGYPKDCIAIPDGHALNDFERVVDLLVDPPLLSSFQGASVRLFEPADKLSDVLTHMRAGDYSQVVLRVDGNTVVLTTEGIARWLAANCDNEIIDISVATAGETLKHEELGGFALAARTMTIHDAHEIFMRPRKTQLFALVVTEHGRPSEKPIALVTPNDLIERL